MSTPNVLVFGDPIVDRNVFCTATHIAPDAPVPVVRRDREELRPGGMWNTARNLAAAGGNAIAVWPQQADCPLDREIMGRFLAEDSSLIPVPVAIRGWRTQVKTRFIGQYGRQMLRVDEPKNPRLETAEIERLIVVAQELCDARRLGVDTVVVCDYGVGLVGDAFCARLAGGFPGAQIIVDPYPTTAFSAYNGAGWLKMNAAEYDAMRKRDVYGTLERSFSLVVTNGALPTLLQQADGRPSQTQRAMAPLQMHVPTRPTMLVDPCGAGDVFLAHFAVEMARGNDPAAAVRRGNLAASLSVEKIGVQVVTAAEVDQLANPIPETRV